MKFLADYPLAPLTTLRVGGRAHSFCRATQIKEVEEALFYARDQSLPLLILGRGSNLLIPDEGFPGLVLHNCLEGWRIQENCLFAFAGEPLPALSLRTVRSGLGGFEFGIGIPGSLGGALFMNAGAGGSTISDRLVEMDLLSFEGERRTLAREELLFGYRTSPFQQNHAILLHATFLLEPSKEARRLQQEMVQARRTTQPLAERSAGSIFRNPPGHSAGRLIEEAGLKGRRVGDALVSPLHANFIVNRGTARACDIEELIEQVKERVWEMHGVQLEEEIRRVTPAISS